MNDATLKHNYKFVNQKITSLAGFYFKMLNLILSAQKLLLGKGRWSDVRFSFAKS